MFLLNSRLGQFCATLQKGHPFSRSYGVRLPSSLTRAHSITLGLSSLPTRVGLRYGHSYFNGNEAFLDGLGLARVALGFPSTPHHLQLPIRDGFAYPGLTYSGGRTMSVGHAQPTLPCPPSASTRVVRE
jgi:hypothetical protein